MVTFLEILLMLVGLFLILVILLQRGRGGGLAGAFGGLGGQSAFGTKAGDIFTWLTIGTACVWVLLACIAGWRARVDSERYYSQRSGASTTVPGIPAPSPDDEKAGPRRPATGGTAPTGSAGSEPPAGGAALEPGRPPADKPAPLAPVETPAEPPTEPSTNPATPAAQGTPTTGTPEATPKPEEPKPGSPSTTKGAPPAANDVPGGTKPKPSETEPKSPPAGPAVP